MRGEFSTAFALLDDSAATLAGFGPTLDAAVSHPKVFVAILAGDLERAERHLKAGRRILERWESAPFLRRPRLTSHRLP